MHRVSTAIGTIGHPAFSANFAPIDEKCSRAKTFCRVPCGKIKKLFPAAIRSCPTFNKFIKSSRGLFRPNPTKPMSSAARANAGKCVSDIFVTTLNGPYVNNTGGNKIVSYVDM